MGTPRGVLVYVYTISATQTVTGVTYGGVAMTQVAGGAAIDTTTEPGRVDTFFLGESIPTGAQTIVVSRTNNATRLYASAATQTAAGNSEVTGIVLLQNNGTYAVQSVNDGSLGANSLRYAAGYSGGANVLAAGAGSTVLNSIDFGAFTCTTARESTAGAGARNVGFTFGTSDDRAAVHLAVRETRTTLATGTDPAAATVPPGAAATDVNNFTLQTSGGTEALTSVTVNLSTSSGVGRLAITDNSDVELGFTTTPATGANAISVSGMSATSTLTTFKVRVTPLIHTAMPAVPGAAYAITAPVTSWAGSNTLHNGSDTNTNALTIDNLSPSSATATSGTAGEAQVTLNWTASASADLAASNGSLVYRWAAASAGAEVPVEGSTPVLGSTNGAATVACLVSSAASSALVRIDGSGGSAECTAGALTKDQPYTYVVFQQDASGNFDAGFAIGSFTPTYPTVVSINRAGASPTSAATVAWTVSFSSSVTGVDATDFSLAATGLSGAFIAAVSGSGTSWTVTANTGIGSGAGTLGLNLVDDDTIIDASGRKLGATGANNGNFTGEVYSINATPALANYRMDELSWNGTANEVVDSSGNGNHAQAFNSASTDSASPVLAGSPGTCRYGVFDNGGTITQGYVETPLPNLTTDFTIAAWVRTTNNATAGQRILIDDNNNTAGYGFSLGDGAAGRLRFFSRGITPVIFDSTYTIASNTWYFVAAVADITNQKRTLYVFDSSGALLATDAEAVAWTGTWGIDAGPVSIGAETNASTETPATFHFRGNLDEVRVYQKVLSQNALAAIATQTHACPVYVPDHLVIQSSGSGLTCAASTLTVVACQDAPCATPFTLGVSGTFSATGAPTVNWDGTTGGATGAGFVIPNGSSSITKDVQVATAGTVVFGIASATPVPTNPATCNFGAPTCTFTANTAGFIYSDTTTGSSYTIPSQVSGVATPTLYLRALQTSTTNPAVCTPAIISQTTGVNMGYTCNNPAACQAGNLTTINATPVASGGTSVSLSFDANGSAPITARYDDAGQITLNASKTVTPFAGATAIALNGSSNAYVVKPHHFDLSAIQQTAAPNLANPAAADATGNKFVKAGEQFSATVTAKNALGGTAANFGQESSAESVKLTSALTAGLGLTSNPAISGTFGAFSNGAATGTSFAWSEVGIITLTPSIADTDYLGAGDVSGTASGNVGRFYPDHFDTDITGPMNCGALSFAPACPAGNNLVYSGQAFSTQVTARNLAGTTTANFAYSATAANNFARTVTLSSVDALGGVAIPGGVGTLSAATAADSTFAAGSNSLALAAPVFSFATTPAAPTNVFIRAIDGDGVTSLRSPSNTSVEGGVKVVSGRLLIENMYGPPAPRLATKARALYWTGTQWALNSSDTQSGAATGSFALGATTACPLGVPNYCGVTLLSAALLGAGGEFRVILSPPTTGSGRRDVLLNSTLSYLAGSGREIWGSFRAPYIYQQER